MEQGLQRKGPGDGKAWLTPLGGVEWGGPTSGTCGFAASLGWTQGLGSQNWKDRVLGGPPRRTTVLPQYYHSTTPVYQHPAPPLTQSPQLPSSQFPPPFPVFPRRN